RSRNSWRVRASAKAPRQALVRVVAPDLATPRISMHMWRAWTTTMAPAGRKRREEPDHLLGEPLLDLRPPRVVLDDAGQLGEADHAVLRQIGQVGRAEEG